MPSPRIPLPRRGATTEELVDVMHLYKKELEFVLLNLDGDNVPVIPSMGQKIGENYSGITANENQIQLLVTDVEGNGAAITINSDQIQSVVLDVQGNSSSITQNADQIALNVTKITETDGKVTTNESNIVQNANQISLNVSEIITVDGKTATNKSDITINANQIALNVQDIDGNKTNITQNANQISLAATDIDNNAAAIIVNSDGITSLVSDVNLNTTSITQNATDITLRVQKDDVINQINLSQEAIEISGNKINLVGAVTVLSEITGNLGTITAGVINGVTINIDDDIKVGNTIQVGVNDNDNKIIEFVEGATTYGQIWANPTLNNFVVQAVLNELHLLSNGDMSIEAIGNDVNITANDVKLNGVSIASSGGSNFSVSPDSPYDPVYIAVDDAGIVLLSGPAWTSANRIGFIPYS